MAGSPLDAIIEMDLPKVLYFCSGVTYYGLNSAAACGLIYCWVRVGRGWPASGTVALAYVVILIYKVCTAIGAGVGGF